MCLCKINVVSQKFMFYKSLNFSWQPPPSPQKWPLFYCCPAMFRIEEKKFPEKKNWFPTSPEKDKKKIVYIKKKDNEIFLYIKKYIFKFEIRYILIDLDFIFPMKPSEFKIYISVESYHENTAENYRNDTLPKRE